MMFEPSDCESALFSLGSLVDKIFYLPMKSAVQLAGDLKANLFENHVVLVWICIEHVIILIDRYLNVNTMRTGGPIYLT